jgi:hypothetical protein
MYNSRSFNQFFLEMICLQNLEGLIKCFSSISAINIILNVLYIEHLFCNNC